MGKYLLKRVLLFIPTLMAISLIAFLVSVSAPGDPAERMMNLSSGEAASGRQGPRVEALKEAKRKELGLDLPLFYFSLGTLSDPDTVHSVTNRNERQMLLRLSRETGNTGAVIQYYRAIKALKGRAVLLNAGALKSDSRLMAVEEIIGPLLEPITLSEAKARLIALSSSLSDSDGLTSLRPDAASARSALLLMENEHAYWKTLIPTVHFSGLQNQYHRWLMHAVRGDFGISYRSRQPVMQLIAQKFWWSFSLSMMAIILAFIISIPLGVFAAGRRGGWADNFSAIVLLALYALPVFFAGSLLLVLFASPDFLHWFPESGVQDPLVYDPAWPFYRKLVHWAPYLVLPLITYVYGSIAFLSRQMRSAMLEVIHQDFIRTARAKGLPERKVIWKHALRNALLPLITVFSQAFPLAVAGSIIIEVIFSIPGMGLEIYESAMANDYPVIVAVFTLFGLFTVAGYLLGDILYAMADPRITYD